MKNIKKIGKYTISGEIGQGGMGVVYRAQDPLIGRTVAIKTIRLDILQQETGKDEALKRFLREAQSAGNLSHSNIVTIYDVGEDEGLIYIAMEFIEGQSLEDLLKQNKKFSLDEIVQLFSQIGAALDYAHEKGIVHRDIKPANILVDQNHKV
ncbi:MAG: serine/threonine-protein kinase, partial [Chrysiogenales bacterium]